MYIYILYTFLLYEDDRHPYTATIFRGKIQDE